MTEQDLTFKLYRTARYEATEVDGRQQVDLIMVDVADVIEAGKRKPKIRLVASDRPQLLRDLAAWVELGEPSADEAREAGDAR